MVSNFRKHILTHKDSKEISQLLALERSARYRQQTLLRNKGDHEHNLAVKKHKKGELIVSRRHSPFCFSDYGPCPSCLEWMKVSASGKRHQTTCPAIKGKTNMTIGETILASAVLTGDVMPQASKALTKEVLPIMRRDETSAIAQQDSLIVALGNDWLRQNIDNVLKRKYYTSSRMRGAARLLKKVRELTDTQFEMMHYIKPEYFDKMCEAALQCAEIDDE